MSTTNYVISARAKADIKTIATYTIKKFGEDQSLKYAQGLKHILTDLGNNPELGKRYVAIKNKMLFRYRYKAHVLFYYIMEDGIFVVRVLGGRMVS